MVDVLDDALDPNENQVDEQQRKEVHEHYCSNWASSWVNVSISFLKASFNLSVVNVIEDPLLQELEAHNDEEDVTEGDVPDDVVVEHVGAVPPSVKFDCHPVTLLWGQAVSTSQQECR